MHKCIIIMVDDINMKYPISLFIVNFQYFGSGRYSIGSRCSCKCYNITRLIK